MAGVAAGIPRARWDAAQVAEREFVTELSCTLRLPVRSAENLIAESQTLLHELPATRAALHDGSITYRHAQVLINQSWSLPAEALAGFEQALLQSAPHLTVSNLKNKARIMRERLHPESITARHQKSLADRTVIFEPEADGMASLSWHDSAEKVKAAHDRLTVMGMSLQGPNETRTLTQLRADVFEDLILDGVTASGVGQGIRGSVHVTVPVMTLLGHSEQPGHLEGYGPIDPDTAREIAAGAPGFIRILTHPETGVVLSVGRTFISRGPTSGQPGRRHPLHDSAVEVGELDRHEPARRLRCLHPKRWAVAVEQGGDDLAGAPGRLGRAEG
nr:DUF222 domain-containing protein [Cryobacterium sp. M25]